jgi:hypothetical protein
MKKKCNSVTLLKDTKSIGMDWVEASGFIMKNNNWLSWRRAADL